MTLDFKAMRCGHSLGPAPRTGVCPARGRRGVLSLALMGLIWGVLIATWARPVAAASDPDRAVQLEREVARLKLELERVNAEVHGLKNVPRTVRGDYLLRTRMADAEALGRRLTDAETALRAARGSSGTPSRGAHGGVGVGPEPRPLPTDGPVELAAKSDILLDQAQQLLDEADRLERRAVRADRRNTLRKGVRRLERDPFISLEFSRRNLVIANRRGNDTGPGDNDDGSPAQESTVANDSAGSLATADTSAPPNRSSTDDQVSSSGAGAHLPNDFQGPGGVSVASGFQTLLDPETVAEIRQLERSGTPAQALVKAAQALRVRSAALKARAAGMRSAAGER